MECAKDLASVNGISIHQMHSAIPASQGLQMSSASMAGPEMRGELVLVTGASGFLGSYVVKLLLENGYRVRGTVRSLQNDVKVKPLCKLSENATFPLELVEADLNNAESWVEAVKDCVYVHHVASPFIMVNPQDGSEIIDPAVNGTLSVLKACSSSVKRVVLTSSYIAAVGVVNAARGKPYTEDEWCDPESTDNYYIKSKILAERAAWDYMKTKPAEQTFDLAVINPGFILGPVVCGGIGESVGAIKMMMEREELALLNIAFPIADVRDVAQAHLIAMTNTKASSHRHFITSQPATFPQIAEILREEFDPQGYNVLSLVAPTCLAHIMGVFVHKIKSILPILNNLPSLDNSRMQNVLNIEPRKMRNSVLDMTYSMIEAGFIYRSSGYTGPKYSEPFP